MSKVIKYIDRIYPGRKPRKETKMDEIKPLTKSEKDIVCSDLRQNRTSLEDQISFLDLTARTVSSFHLKTHNPKLEKLRLKIGEAQNHLEKVKKCSMQATLILNDCNNIGHRIARVSEISITKSEKLYYRDADGRIIASVMATEQYTGFWQFRVDIGGYVHTRAYADGIKSCCKLVVMNLSKQGYHIIRATAKDAGVVHGPYREGKLGYYRKNASGLSGKFEAFKKGWDKALRVDTIAEAEEFLMEE